MKNRYGQEFSFEPVGENKYKFVGDVSYCRFGGKENTEGVDKDDLGFFDPSGGPFISVGHYFIENRRVKRISSTMDGVIFEVENL